MQRCRRDCGADDVPDAIVPRPSVTAGGVVTLCFPPRRALPRRKGESRGGAFHLAFRTLLGVQGRGKFWQSISNT